MLGATDSAPETFAGALERPLTAEQIARSWRIATGFPSEDKTLRRAVIGAIPEVLPREYTASFQQAQFLTNAPALAEILKPSPNNATTRIAALPNATARVNASFLAVYGRTPDNEEATQSVAFLAARSEKPEDGVRDLLWALMTSAEFLTMP